MDSSPIPLMPGPWRSLSAGHAAGFALRLGRLLEAPLSQEGLQPGQPMGGLRAMPLSFYPGWALIEGEAQAGPGVVGTFDVLYGPSLMWLIDGESRLLNELNAGLVPADLQGYAEEGTAPGARIASPLAALDAQRSGPDFIRFYCACVWGEEGPFMPVESPRSPVLRGIDASRERWADEIRPITAAHDGDTLVAEGLIAYGRSLFHTRLRLRNGSVTMEDDRPLATDVLPQRRHETPLRDLREAGAAGAQRSGTAQG